MATTAEVIEIVDELQLWLESQCEMGMAPAAMLHYTAYTSSISIDELCVWDDQDCQGEEGLTLQWCKDKWLEYVHSLCSQFMSKVDQPITRPIEQPEFEQAESGNE